MDAAAAQQPADAIQALATAAAAIPPPPAPPAPTALAADPLTSPYKGGPLDLASWIKSVLRECPCPRIQVYGEGQRSPTLPCRPHDKSQDVPL